MKSFTLANGQTMPAFGLGTWKVSPEDTGPSVRKAIELGYRNIDCAFCYGNEPQVGEALSQCFKDGLVKREDIFVTSKLWNTDHLPQDVMPALKKSMEDLQLEYLDLYLIHWPVALKKEAGFPPQAEHLMSLQDAPISDTWAEMEKAVDEGLVRGIGLSNFSVEKVRSLITAPTTRIKPVLNQVERHPYLQQLELVEYCNENGVHVTGYSPLGSRDRPSFVSKEDDEPILTEDSTIVEIAKRHELKPAEVLLAWAVKSGTSTLAKSSNPGRLQENLSCVQDDDDNAAVSKLDDSDMDKIKALDKKRRFITGEFWCAEGGPYTMANLWDE